MKYKTGDFPKLYLAACSDDKPFVGNCWRIIATNTQRCKCTHCQFNWTAGNKMSMPADYVLDISPETDINGPLLMVYEWQLVKPIENEDEIHEEEEINA